MKEGTVKKPSIKSERTAQSAAWRQEYAYYAREAKMGNMWRRRCQEEFHVKFEHSLGNYRRKAGKK